VSSPSGVRGRAPAENGFWHILKATERSFLYLYDKNLRGTICTSVPLLQILGGLVPSSPRDLRPWSLSVTRTALTVESADVDTPVIGVRLSARVSSGVLLSDISDCQVVTQHVADSDRAYGVAVTTQRRRNGHIVV